MTGNQQIHTQRLSSDYLLGLRSEFPLAGRSIRIHKQRKGECAYNQVGAIDFTDVLGIYAENCRSGFPESRSTSAEMRPEMVSGAVMLENVEHRQGFTGMRSVARPVCENRKSPRSMAKFNPIRLWDRTTLFDKVPELESREVHAEVL